MRTLELESWIHRPQRGRLYGYGNFKAPWAKMTDGIFFINRMTPSQPVVTGS
jgi:hypothetical protein